MGLFKPLWQSENFDRMEKALDRLPQRKLLKIIRSENDSWEVISAQREAVFRLDPDSLKAVALDDNIRDDLRLSAVDQIKDEKRLVDLVRSMPEDRVQWDDVSKRAMSRLGRESIAAIALDPSACARLRVMAVSRVTDEKILEEYIQDENAWERSEALKRMRTGTLVATYALKQGMVYEGYKRLAELKDDESMCSLALGAEEMSRLTASDIAEYFTKDVPFLGRLAREARSAEMRDAALNELVERGIILPDLCADARKRAFGLMSEPRPDSHQILVQLKTAAPGPLIPEERDALYREFLKDPWVEIIPRYLEKCGDPAGAAFLPFIDKLYIEDRPVSREDLNRVLDVPEDFALDYLLKFIRWAKGGNGRLNSPERMIKGCADAVCLMHANGRARERIERELKAVQDYDISYTYSDSENDIRDDEDRFTVRFWE